jgi:cytochrome c5
MPFRRLSALLLALGLGACGEQTTSTGAGAEAASRALTPGDPAIAAIYQRSCRNCHSVAATGAPLTGDVPAWAPRLEKGMDALVDNVVNGFGGMPPFGLCMDCDVDQFEALTRFMATGE